MEQGEVILLRILDVKAIRMLQELHHLTIEAICAQIGMLPTYFNEKWSDLIRKFNRD